MAEVEHCGHVVLGLDLLEAVQADGPRPSGVCLIASPASGHCWTIKKNAWTKIFDGRH